MRISKSRSSCLIASTCAAALGSIALAAVPTTNYAHFGAVTDTIQILGNTHFGGGDFTYEMNIRVAGGTVAGHIISEQRDTYEDKTMTLSANGDYIFSGSADNSGTGDLRGTIPGMVADTWMHLAYVHQGGTSTIYVDGQAQVIRAAPYAYGDHDGSWMSIGMFRYGAGWGATGPHPSFLGDLDWIRVSAGAKYTQNFVPPTEAQILADSSTQLLLRFNEAKGTAVLTDESSNHFTCNMGVPVYPGVTATAPALVPAPGALAIFAGLGRGARRRRQDHLAGR